MYKPPPFSPQKAQNPSETLNNRFLLYYNVGYAGGQRSPIQEIRFMPGRNPEAALYRKQPLLTNNDLLSLEVICLREPRQARKGATVPFAIDA